MRSINEVLAPQKFKSDFQVKREKQLIAVKKKAGTVNQIMSKLVSTRINQGLRPNQATKRPFMDINASATPSPYQPSK